MAKTIEVYGEAVSLPSRAERRDSRGWSLADHQAANTAEHDAGCHGPHCDGRCAERSYARWSVRDHTAKEKTVIWKRAKPAKTERAADVACVSAWAGTCAGPLSYGPDPFAQEINGDDTDVWECAHHRAISADDI